MAMMPVAPEPAAPVLPRSPLAPAGPAPSRVRVRAFFRRESFLLPEVSPSPRPSSSRERENEKALLPLSQPPAPHS